MAKKLNEDLFVSGQAPASGILKSTFISRLTSLFGYRPASDKARATNAISSKYGLELVRVDLNSDAYRFKDAALGSVFDSHQLAEPLEKYFDAYMDETTLSYNDIQDRQKRLNELSFFYYNDVFGSRVVELTAAEATQLDVQNRILSVESPNMNFTNKCYELFSQWGITQQRIQGVCKDLELYGESFWAHKLGLNGIEKIIPIRPNSIMERLEFSPVHMAEYLAQRDGYATANKDRHSKLSTLIDVLKSEQSMDYAENLADMFDNKLLGYELQDGLVVPPWCITHFRYNAENSEFYPYGRPPLLNCLAPFKQTYSTMMLQGLARSMSFPVTLYKVKGTEGMGPAIAFEHVNTVREEYDNLGVTPASAGGEVYTVNTKIWVPDGLLDVEVKESKCDIDFVGDIELYQDRVAIASGVPKAYLDQEFGGFGNSGISLTEQFKPFARHVYTIQSAFLEGLGELIRLHFAITGEFNYNTPFILSMRFPAEEMGEEKREARKDSLEMAQSIIDLITGALGLEEGDPLPDDVVVDILSKYSFLDPTDIEKWMKLSSFLKPVKGDDDEGGDDGGSEDFDIGGSGDDTSTDDTGEDTSAGADTTATESRKYTAAEVKKILRENSNKHKLNEAQRKRLREVSKHYKEVKEDLFFHYLENQHLTEYTNKAGNQHVLYVPKLTENAAEWEAVQVIKHNSNAEASGHLKEEGPEEMVQDEMNKLQEQQYTKEEIAMNTKIEKMAAEAIQNADKIS